MVDIVPLTRFLQKKQPAEVFSESLIDAEVCLLTGGDYMAAKRRYALENREVGRGQSIGAFRCDLPSKLNESNFVDNYFLKG